MSTAPKIYNAAFAPETGRDLRSDAYKRGVLDALRYAAGEGPKPTELMPYPLGTTDYDAWFAGLEEGYARWRDHEGKCA